MGRPFKQELESIGETYMFSSNVDSSKLEKYILNNLTTPFLVIGSGGSFAVALSCALLIESLGGFSKAITPFELMNSTNGLHSCNVMFFSASGNNADIINAYNFCKKNEARSTFILCIRESSKLVAEATSKYNDDSYLEISLPHGKDGFLAVNSSICALSIFERSFNNITNCSTGKPIDIKSSLSDDVLACLDARSIIALGGRWTTPVVADFESKCTEAGLANLMPADLRNFAHGRHHWIAKNPDTSVICFVTSSEKALAEKTIKLLPASIKTSIIVSERIGISATIELMFQLFYIVQKLGENRGIDPGKPGVPEYGRKLYHLCYNPLSETGFSSHHANNILARTALRKAKRIGLSGGNYIDISIAAKNYLSRLSAMSFGGLVFDYDNTIIKQNDVTDSTYIACIERIKLFAEAGIPICFATGRGKSIREQLINLIPEHLQEMIYICYYGGASILPLAETPAPATNHIAPVLQEICAALEAETAFADITKSLRNTCISVEGPIPTLTNVYSFLTRKILENEISGVKLAKSDHSIDITLSSVSKRSAITFLKEKCCSEVLCIGDSGDETGNDYALLDHEYALSVGSISISTKTCWNIASLGLSGPNATLEYLSKLIITKKGLRFSKAYLKI